jgi:arginine exporter protein ArgO
MHERCPHCGIRLEPEPGFYQGAMYVSYAFTVAITMVAVIIYSFTDNPSEWLFIGAVIGSMLILLPINYRYSRTLYLYFFGGIKYDPRLSK